MTYISYELNYGYHLRIFYKKDIDLRSKSKAADELTKKLRNLMVTYRENVQHAQKLQKQVYNKGTKPKNFAFGEKIWLNRMYIKTKYNQKLEIKLFGSFRVLYLVDN